jgi:integrase
MAMGLPWRGIVHWTAALAQYYLTDWVKQPDPKHRQSGNRLTTSEQGSWRHSANGQQVSRYNIDWVFASRRHRGRKPIWGQAILRRYIRPVAQRAGIQKQLGWHALRHTYSTLLRSVGTELKVMQELLRHSSFRSTLNVDTQAVSPAKHAAQAAVLDLVFASETNCAAAA